MRMPIVLDLRSWLRGLTLGAGLCLFVALMGCAGSSSDPPSSAGLAISSNSLPDGQAGASYQFLLDAGGGTAPYQWVMSSGQLPPGLALGSSGQISGTPTASGQYNFGVQVTDSSNPRQSATAPLLIRVAVLSLVISTTGLPMGNLGAAYYGTLNASGGTAPYTWSIASGSLPSGLALSTDGHILGTPSMPGNSTFTVEVSDSSGPVETTTASESIQVSPATFDAYGGRTDITCSTGATGYWTMQKINNAWWFCDPLGNAFFMHAVEEVNFAICHTDAGGQGCNVNRFGSAENWAQATAQRLLSWGFNTYGVGAYGALVPWNATYGGVKDQYGNVTIPYKLPVIGEVSAMPYATSGNPSYNPGSPVKLVEFAVPSAFTGYVSNGGFPADIYDPNFWTFVKSNVGSSLPAANSPYMQYVLGTFSDDSDYTFGLIQSYDSNFDGSYSGVGERYGWVVAIVSPIQYADRQAFAGGALYPDDQVYTKTAWQNYLESKYSTIAALDSAWGANYTTFGSSGTAITGETMGTGDGSTKGFSHTLADLTPSGYSVGIFVGGSLVGGDDGHGNIWGPSVSGTIDYSTGAVSLAFSSAPAAGAAITVNYVQNGWCIGTGVMDECDQSSHRTWMGTDTTGTALTGANANLIADVDAFSGQAATYYLSQYRAAIHSVYPNLLFFGPDVFSGYAALPYPWILSAISGNVDAIELSGEMSQSYLNEINKYAGDIPIISPFYTQANADSELNGSTTVPSQFNTQDARGQYYLSTVEAQYQASYPDGVRPYVGTNWWRYYDDWTEGENWGLVTARDNAYDGHEDVTAQAPCSPPIQSYTCGGDIRDSGNVIDAVRQGNSYWLSH